MSIGGAAGGVEELRQRVRGLKLERARTLALRDAERFAIGGFRRGRVALGEDVPQGPVQE